MLVLYPNVGNPQDFKYICTEGVLLSASKATYLQINAYGVDVHRLIRQVHDVTNPVVAHAVPCLRLIFTSPWSQHSDHAAFSCNLMQQPLPTLLQLAHERL